MKKNLLLLIVFCFVLSPVINAQLEKGRIVTGVASTLNLLGLNDEGLSPGSDLMSLGFSKYKYSSSGGYEYEYKLRGLNLLPRAGYFVIDNLAVGLDVILSTTSWIDMDDNDKWIASVICAGPFARFYYPLEKFYPFAEVNAAIGTLRYKRHYSGSDPDVDKNSIIMFGGGIGAAFPLGERVTFDVMAGYSYLRSKEKDSENVENGGSSDSKTQAGTLGIKMGFLVFFDYR